MSRSIHETRLRAIAIRLSVVIDQDKKTLGVGNISACRDFAYWLDGYLKDLQQQPLSADERATADQFASIFARSP